MKRSFITLAALALILGACDKIMTSIQPPEAGVPEPTTQELLEEMRQVLKPLSSLLVKEGLGEPGYLTDDAKAQTVAVLREIRTRNEVTENGREANSLITHDIADMVWQARDLERYRLVLGTIEAYEVMAPGTTKMRRLKERATIMRNRPSVQIKGFFDDEAKDKAHVFVHVTVFPSETVHKLQIREKEEFFGLRYVDSFGSRERGIELEYLDMPGYTWKVYGP